MRDMTVVAHGIDAVKLALMPKHCYLYHTHVFQLSVLAKELCQTST